MSREAYLSSNSTEFIELRHIFPAHAAGSFDGIDLLQIDMDSLPHAQTLKAIELFGTRVAPQVRKALG